MGLVLGGLYTLNAMIDCVLVTISTPQHSNSGLEIFRSGLSWVLNFSEASMQMPPPLLFDLSILNILYPGIVNVGVCFVNHISHSNNTSGHLPGDTLSISCVRFGIFEYKPHMFSSKKVRLSLSRLILLLHST